MPLAALLRRLRPAAADELHALEGYREQIEPWLARATAIRDEWLDLAQAARDSERLANVASVYRWELMRAQEQALALPTPRLAADARRLLALRLGDAARACQLLATGHRYNKSEAVCDGQALLVETVGEIERLGRRLDARLSAG